MRKFEFLNYTVDGKQQICYQNPIQQMQSLCGLVFHKFAYTKTTKPVNCPDCLAIIRECKELDLVPKPESKMTFKRVVGGDTPIRVFDKDVYIGLITINDSKEYVFNGYTKEVITEFRSAAITAKLRKLNGEKK